MELRAQFEQFLRDIRPSDRNREEWKMGSSTLRSRLLKDPDLSELIVSSFLQGSVRRSTAVRPTSGKRSDVDVVIVTTIDHGAEAPIDAMKRFEPFLERHYAGKWARQDRSFGIELSYVDLDLVVTALPSDPAEREMLVEIYKSDAVETTASLEERSDWQLNKKWDRDQNSVGSTAFHIESAQTDTNWRPNPLMLPDRVLESWGETHPLAQIQWTADKNRRCNGHYVSVVRAAKWWRHEHADELPKYPKGYPLEHMIGHVLPDGIESVAQGLTLAFEGIRDTFGVDVEAGRVPVLCDHGVPSHNVMKRVEPSDFAAFHTAASSAADAAREALESADASQSGEMWRRLLGTSFPLPGPGGGDRPRGFTPPSQPAAPKSDRFA